MGKILVKQAWFAALFAAGKFNEFALLSYLEGTQVVIKDFTIPNYEDKGNLMWA